MLLTHRSTDGTALDSQAARCATCGTRSGSGRRGSRCGPPTCSCSSVFTSAWQGKQGWDRVTELHLCCHMPLALCICTRGVVLPHTACTPASPCCAHCLQNLPQPAPGQRHQHNVHLKPRFTRSHIVAELAVQEEQSFVGPGEGNCSQQAVSPLLWGRQPVALLRGCARPKQRRRQEYQQQEEGS